MTRTSRGGGLDRFRVVAALMVMAIHTSPLAAIDGTADFILTRILARTAVPFFFMTTGHFLLPALLFETGADRQPLRRFLWKNGMLYVLAILFYLPLNLYAGHFRDLDAAGLVRMLLVDGTFYHLWYFPAVVTGVLFVSWLGRKLPFPALMAIGVLLYGFGLLGDSYYGAVSAVPFLNACFQALFTVVSFTRNGLFYAPVYLLLGAWLARRGPVCGRRRCAEWTLFFMLLLVLEGLLLHRSGWQRHDSMYLAMPLCMLFLFQLVATGNGSPQPKLRTISMWMYLIHPLVIVLVRGGAKAAGVAGLLVENNLFHSIAVMLLSVALSITLAELVNEGALLHKANGFGQGRAWVEVSRAALRHNVDVLRGILPDGCELMPAVKTDAYGHGAVTVARELNRLGVKAFCVASAQEGRELRVHGVRGTILVLGYTHPACFPLLRRYQLTQTVVDHSYAEALRAYGKRIRVHVKIDTGMHRLGERSDHPEDIIRIFRMRNLRIEGVFTHLCVSDDKSPEGTAFTRAQAAAFQAVVDTLREHGFSCPKKHLVSSDGLLHYPELAEDYARVGIALYGVAAPGESGQGVGHLLEPVLSVKARIALVKPLHKGEAAGYGLHYVAQEDARLAVVTIGYGDGIPRALSCGVGNVLVHGCKAPIVGAVCMDQLLADVTGIPDVKPGEIAVLVGRLGTERITAGDLASQCGTIPNEILSRLGPRLVRTVTA